MTLIVRWFINALALMLVAYLYSGVHVDNIFAALIAALVLGLVNAFVRPVLVFLTLPVTILPPRSETVGDFDKESRKFAAVELCRRTFGLLR